MWARKIKDLELSGSNFRIFQLSVSYLPCWSFLIVYLRTFTVYTKYFTLFPSSNFHTECYCGVIVVDNILERLVNIQCVQTRLGCVQAVRTLAHHHPKVLVTSLINQPLPFDT
jgi:hypothetical protein